jgi:hypothetical protein
MTERLWRCIRCNVVTSTPVARLCPVDPAKMCEWGGTDEQETTMNDDARAALAAAEPRWQPIETAPKDGTEIFACWSASKTVSVVSWFGDAWADANRDEVYVSPPTHWMPLPPPPGDDK